MSDLKAKMHQNRWDFAPDPSGPLAGFKGSYFSGKGRGAGKGRDEGE